MRKFLSVVVFLVCITPAFAIDLNYKKTSYVTVNTTVTNSVWTSLSVTPSGGSTATSPGQDLVFTSFDATPYLYAGVRLRFVQNGVTKSAIVCTSSYSTNSTVSILVNNDYSVESVVTYPISSFEYSQVKAPPGFDLNPAKWTITVIDTVQRSFAWSTNGTVYNNAADQITIPVGSWRVGMHAKLAFTNSSEFSGYAYFGLAYAADQSPQTANFMFYSLLFTVRDVTFPENTYLNTGDYLREQFKTISTPTTLYLNVIVYTAVNNYTTILYNDEQQLELYAICNLL